MENNYEFWEDYLKKLKRTINKLCHEKSELLIDLHIHSNYSADGKQSIKEIIDTTKDKEFDIIAITDHDTVNGYDEVYDIIKNGLTRPLIIPGVEFTIDNREYGNQCHFLQLFINPKDKKLLHDVNTNYQAMFKRSNLQFKRIEENRTLQRIFKDKKIKVSYQEYIKYLEEFNFVPEYDTLCLYLMNKFKERKVNNFQILEHLEEDNKLDIYANRQEYKSKRYRKLREKYEVNEINKYIFSLFLFLVFPFVLSLL